MRGGDVILALLLISALLLVKGREDYGEHGGRILWSAFASVASLNWPALAARLTCKPFSKATDARAGGLLSVLLFLLTGEDTFLAGSTLAALTFFLHNTSFWPLLILVYGLDACFGVNVILFYIAWRWLGRAMPGSFTPGESVIVASFLVWGVLGAGRVLFIMENNQLYRLVARLFLGLVVVMGMVWSGRPIARKWLSWLGLIVLSAEGGALMLKNYATIIEQASNIIIFWTISLILVAIITGLYLKFLPNPTKFQHHLIRKFYHIMALVMFTRVVIYQRHFLLIAMLLVELIFLAVEMGRVMRLVSSSIERSLNWFMNQFRSGSLDRGEAILSHFWLLFGMSLPLILVEFEDDKIQVMMMVSYPQSQEQQLLSLSNRKTILAMSGLMALGVLDAVAAIAGQLLKGPRWSESLKTIAGSIVGATIMTIAWKGVELYCLPNLQISWLRYMIQAVICALWEAWSNMNDNLTLPIISYASAQLLFCCK